MGRYPVEACTETVAYQNNSWTDTTNDPRLEAHTTCGEPLASYQSSTIANLEIADVMGLTKEIPVGVEGTWKIVAPIGEDIVEATGDSSLYRAGATGWQIYRETENTDGQTTVEQSCGASTESCALGGAFQATALHARSLSFTARCEAEEYEAGKFFTTCPGGGTIHNVRAGVNYATIVLEDPTVPANVTASHVPVGAQHGTISIDGSATDTLAGLLSLSVVNSEGQTIAGPITVPGGCNYSEFTPCPTSTSELSIPINTETLADGEHQLRIDATNAAHDEGFSAPFTLDVNNHPEEPHNGGSGKSSGEENKSKESGAGNGNASSSPGNTSSNGNSGQGQKEQKPDGKPLPVLSLRLDRLHVHRHYLSLSGTTQTSARGWLRLIFHFIGSRHHESSLVRRVAIHNGRFMIRIALPARCPNKAELAIDYAGDRTIRLTTSHRRISLPMCSG